MIEISPYEFMAREFERLAILRKMWSAAEVAKIIRRYDIERQGERDPTNPFAPRYELRKDADEIKRLREALERILPHALYQLTQLEDGLQKKPDLLRKTYAKPAPR